jgi:glycosyltransferase involved in cell wall biosynthesis
MTRTLFLYRGPHYLHAAFATSINADFLPIYCINWARVDFIEYIGICLTALSLPREYDIYLCESSFIVPAISRKIKKLDETHKIINIFDDPLCYYLYSGYIPEPKRRVVNFLLDEVDAAVCVGKMEAELLNKITKGKLKLVEVKPFIIKERFHRLIRVNPSLENHNILFIGNGPDWFYKGLDLLIASFLRVKKEVKDAQLTIIGNWKPKKDWLVSGVNFVGHQLSLEPYIQNASIYVHLGRGEAFGISVLEAMLGGLPAIVSEWTGAKEVVCNLNHDFVSKLTVEDAADRILKYFDLSLEKKITLSKKSKKLASAFNQDDMIRLFQENFTKLCEKLNR